MSMPCACEPCKLHRWRTGDGPGGGDLSDHDAEGHVGLVARKVLPSPGRCREKEHQFKPKYSSGACELPA